jgi:integrase
VAGLFSTDDVTGIVATSGGQYRVLYALLAGTGLRVGEAAGLEVGDISADGLTLKIRQSVWNGRVQTPKTFSAFREVDLHPSLSAMLKGFVGERSAGMLFTASNGMPISQSNILKRSLYPILKAMERDKAGFHSFRRFRVTHLRKNRAFCVSGLVMRIRTSQTAIPK